MPRTALSFMRLLALGALIAGLAAPPAGADGAEAGRVVAVRFESAEPDPELESVLYLSLGIALADRGYPSAREGGQKDLLLVVAYAMDGEVVIARLTLVADMGKGTELASAEARLRLTLELDVDLEAALDALLAGASLEPREEAVAEIGGLFSSSLVRLEDTLRTKETLRVAALAYGGAVSFIGSFAEYARLGALAALDASVLVLEPSWSLSAGPRFTATRAFMNNGVTGGTVYLGTAGLNLEAGVGAKQAQRLAVCLSGGAAIIGLAREGERTLAKTEPYLDAGLQAGIALGLDAFLGVDLRFVIIFDADMLIMGAAPALSFCKEF